LLHEKNQTEEVYGKLKKYSRDRVQIKYVG
jgi:hypothetical protein